MQCRCPLCLPAPLRPAALEVDHQPASGSAAAQPGRPRPGEGPPGPTPHARGLDPETVSRLATAGARPALLLRGACVLTLDAAIGDFENADVLIDGTVVRAVGPGLAAGDAVEIDASGMIVLPGLIDTHRHSWQGAFRRYAPNADLKGYVSATSLISRAMTPDDVYIGNLFTRLAAVDTGVTTLLDWSHISNSPEHSDAAIAGLKAAGLRSIYAYGHSRIEAAEAQYPEDARRIRREHFSSDDQLVTMYFAADMNRAENWPLGRELGLRITSHVFRQDDPQRLVRAAREGLLGPDVTLVHCTPELGDDGWKAIRDSGCMVSLATTAIAQLGVGAGIPPIQRMLDFGIRPSLSVDMETSLPGDLFTQMRVTFNIQRAPVNQRVLDGDAGAPALLSTRDVLEFTTVESARAIGRSRSLGTLTPGKQADIFVLDAEDLNLFPANNAIGSVVLAAQPHNIKMVFTAGRLVKYRDRILGHDMASIRQALLESRRRVFDKAGLACGFVGDGYA